MNTETPEIKTFAKLMDEIAYSYLDGYKFREYPAGHFNLNKLSTAIAQ